MIKEILSLDDINRLLDEKTDEAREIIFENFKYIIDIYMKKYNKVFVSNGIDEDDAYAEGLFAFNDAINSYSDDKNAGFATFLSLCIRRRFSKLVRKYTSLSNQFNNNTYSLDYSYSDDGVPLVEYIEHDQGNDPLDIVVDADFKDYIDIKIKSELSISEYFVYEQLVKGLSIKEISVKLDISYKSVDNTVQRIKKKVKNIYEND